MCMASDSSRYSAAIKAMWTRSKQKPTAGGRSRAHCRRVNIADAWAVCVQVAASLATHPTSNFLCYVLDAEIHDMPSGIAVHEAVTYRNQAQKALLRLSRPYGFYCGARMIQ